MMRSFAIIGAGFFGLHIAAQIRRRFRSAHIEIFEMESEALGGAATNNQCRLHLGFHYPRSGYTIYQSVMGFDRYVAEYGECVVDIGDNLYAVRSDGLVNPQQYLAVMDSFSLPYDIIPDKSRFRAPEKVDLVLRVSEKCIDPQKLRHRIASTPDVALRCGVQIDGIDAESGRIFSQGEELGRYDFVINATYLDPNLGLPPGGGFHVKHELTALVLCRTSLPAHTALTVMDGPFASVYPAYAGLHTLSSVVHTPFRSYGDAQALYADYPRRRGLAEDDQVSNRIVAHVQSLMDVKVEPLDLWVSAKTKLATEKGDSRVTEVKRFGRLFSVLCGKLDAVFSTSDQIMLEIT
jgi:hypothetical protein